LDGSEDLALFRQCYVIELSLGWDLETWVQFKRCHLLTMRVVKLHCSPVFYHLHEAEPRTFLTPWFNCLRLWLPSKYIRNDPWRVSKVVQARLLHSSLYICVYVIYICIYVIYMLYMYICVIYVLYICIYIIYIMCVYIYIYAILNVSS
jgi:hypothetical protein